MYKLDKNKLDEIYCNLNNKIIKNIDSLKKITIIRFNEILSIRQILLKNNEKKYIQIIKKLEYLSKKMLFIHGELYKFNNGYFIHLKNDIEKLKKIEKKYIVYFEEVENEFRTEINKIKCLNH